MIWSPFFSARIIVGNWRVGTVCHNCQKECLAELVPGVILRSIMCKCGTTNKVNFRMAPRGHRHA